MDSPSILRTMRVFPVGAVRHGVVPFQFPAAKRSSKETDFEWARPSVKDGLL